ncbi:TPA: hypothetical protein NIC27_001534 [Pseudomonas aeruginosa]|uniref:hypothetical protein n=1 Tax=Pseudomonas aeruginosa TaxID=287 RepID=UPI000A927D4F|nr:hypothetical protein [Pseudomonas aeruginosa]MCO7655553.1 hypothetical protein [Pseudomonas aeruginosa]HCF3389128.1 hypothetical protein [Pseudomonas aeruginosa]HCU2063714.1 hypothetical protein [Pseudomonas aeruginosa]HEJ4932901.1 hypothetical protein [Pseudomonas aeruginosa]
MTESKICTCPSGDGSLRWPCPKHPAVEQAGGDERAAFEAAFAAMGRPVCRADYDQDAYGTPFDDGGWTGWQARAALAQPSPAIATAPTYQFHSREIGESDWAPCDFSRYLYCSKSPEMDTRVVEVTAQPSPAQAEQAEAERPTYECTMGVGGGDGNLFVHGDHASIKAAQKIVMERDAALARVAELEQKSAGSWTVDTSCGRPILMYEGCSVIEDQTAYEVIRMIKWFGELEKQEPVALANRGLHAFWVKWTEAAAGLYGPGIKLYAAPVAQAQQLHDLDKQCRDDVARALGLRPNQERGFAWSYLLASIKSCVKASEDSAQAQHSVPEEFIGRLSEFLAQRGTTGKALLRELRAMLAAAPAQGGE